MDFNLTENLDLAVENGIIDYVDDSNNEITLLTALHTDAVVDNERGYWLTDVLGSSLWIYDQSRIDENISSDISNTFRNILNEFVELELYSSFELETETGENHVDIKMILYKDNNAPVAERTIRISGNA